MKLEVFFDYACPYCLRGYELLDAMLPEHPGLEVEWQPCEAHPRPDRYGLHSDLCARAMLYARDQGANLTECHRRLYRAALTEGRDIEDLQVVCALLEGLLDVPALHSALLDGAALDELAENNRLAWEVYGFPAVPSLRLGERQLRSEEDVGLSRERLAAFLAG